MSYNGWTNRATWLVNLWVGDSLFDLAQEEVPLDAGEVENIVIEMLSLDGATVENGLAADLLNYALGEVDWRELAQAANEGVAA